MIRVVKLGRKWYATEVVLEDDLENIQTFTDEGLVVLVAADLADIEEMLGDEDIELVE